MPCGEKRAQTPRRCRAVDSLQSGLSSQYREIRACLRILREIEAGISLRSRLRGGGRGIRTPGTLSGTSVFKTDCFNRSHIPPRLIKVYQSNPFNAAKELPWALEAWNYSLESRRCLCGHLTMATGRGASISPPASSGVLVNSLDSARRMRSSFAI